MGQLANLVSNRTQDTLSSNTEINPREQVNAITLRNGKQLEELPPKDQAKKDE